MTGQEKGDRLIQVTAWAGLTVYTVKELIFMLTNFKDLIKQASSDQDEAVRGRI
jgi:hypothetical protein